MTYTAVALPSSEFAFFDVPPLVVYLTFLSLSHPIATDLRVFQALL